ncbi:repressor of yield of DENV protein, partial [Chelydra serpentina]
GGRGAGPGEAGGGQRSRARRGRRGAEEPGPDRGNHSLSCPRRGPRGAPDAGARPCGEESGGETEARRGATETGRSPAAAGAAADGAEPAHVRPHQPQAHPLGRAPVRLPGLRPRLVAPRARAEAGVPVPAVREALRPGALRQGVGHGRVPLPLLQPQLQVRGGGSPGPGPAMGGRAAGCSQPLCGGSSVTHPSPRHTSLPARGSAQMGMASPCFICSTRVLPGRILSPHHLAGSRSRNPHSCYAEVGAGSQDS